ncbi:endonuclease domain-containing protein [Micromonospora carbonacea]|uniref:endonuclease domain-containing protein n=1 Tax=Micromonospora carbonacea TaxID=47853 RepID=UPI00371FB89E
MPKSPRRPPQLRGRIFRGSVARARGLLTRNDLRSSAWRPLFRDVYADARIAVTHRHRCLAVTRWLVPPGTAIAGRSAAALYGVGSIPPDEPIDVLTPSGPPDTTPNPPLPAVPPGAPPGRRPDQPPPAPDERFPPPSAPVPVPPSRSPTPAIPPQGGRRLGPVAGLCVHRSAVQPGDVVDRAGIPVTSPARTCWDVACWLDVVEAVVVIDGLLARRIVDVPTLREYALARAGRRGWRSLLRAVDLADAGAESPQESRTRVRLVLAGLPRPRTQWVVSDGGRFVARLDLAWPEFRVAVEYDGLWHDDPEQFHRDRRRLNRLLGGDWLVLHVTARRLREDFDGFLAEVRAALRSRGHRPRPQG